MSRVEVDSITDAFGNELRVGDTVVYVLRTGNRSHRLQKGVVERISRNPEVYYETLRIEIRHSPPKEKKLNDGRVYARESGVSPLNHPERIMKIDG